MLVEICTDDLETTLEAIRLGADRIELCSNLDQDGLTPGIDLFCDVMKNVPTAIVFPMIRIRNTFVFTLEEKDQMIEEARKFASLNAPGIVVGALTEEGKVDIDFLKRICEDVIAINSKIEITFHKAIDIALVKSGIECIEEIKPYCKRVLTSGGKGTARENVQVIREINKTIIAIAAGNVRGHNVFEILELTMVDEIHSRDLNLLKIYKNVFPNP